MFYVKLSMKELLFCIVFVLTLITIQVSVLSQTSDDRSCVLDIQRSSSANYSNCKSGSDWGGFLTDDCCTDVFDEYLYALARRARQTGKLFLNSTEQNNCLVSIERFNNHVSGCGIEKLTGGTTGCSSYTKADVVDKLGKESKKLKENCKCIDSVDKFDQVCSACLRSWVERGGLSESVSGLEANICKFAVLITLTSNLIDDQKQIKDVYRCLAVQSSFVENDQAGTDETNSGRKLTTGIILIIVLVVGIFFAIIFISITIICKKRTRENPSAAKNESFHQHSEESNSLKISLQEIYLATNNLDELNFIGQGVAGKVYKGVLSTGQPVAVKHILNDGHAETFVREVTSLSHVRHPNLVALLGFCEHDDESFLIYDLCHNGNLSEWLYGKHKSLSWIQRLEIAIDSARGLWFLHTYPEGCIVHRDIKPTNILIDADFQAKLSDFGLSKVMDLGQSHVSSEVRGTFGYVDPEYRKNHHVHAKGDVYSFGIVLLQLLSGQRVINLNMNRPMQLNKMARFLARGGNVAEFADPKLNGEYSVEAFDIVIKLALSCTGLKQERPSMEKVVLKLEQALHTSTKVKADTLRCTKYQLN